MMLLTIDELMKLPLSDALDAFEKHYIVVALTDAGGVATKAAKRAKMDRSNFRRKMRQYSIERAQKAV